jgi:spore germination protein YaaH
MKKIALLILLVLVGVFLFQPEQKTAEVLQSKASKIPHPTEAISVPKMSLFVPYWTVGIPMDNSYDDYIYFGITVDAEGINTGEPGFANANQFLANVPQGAKKLLTLRMVNNKNSFTVLEDKNLQKTVIEQTVSFAKKNNFSGIVVDLEISSLAFPSVVDNISSFAKNVSVKTKANNLSFGIALFGDSFYRIRPYDVGVLGKQADMIYIMAYDFHKAGGDPGPNFPLNGKDTYGYDFSTMTNDFLHLVPKEKLTFVFGMFGYDWTVDEKQKGVAVAEALSSREMEQKFLPTCLLTNCNLTRDQASKETKITYTDESGKPHIVWYEDKVSTEKKEEFLESKGIHSISFWAHSYF